MRMPDILYRLEFVRCGHLVSVTRDDLVGNRSAAPPLQNTSRYITARQAQPPFANARSICNALDRIRLRAANRLVASKEDDVIIDDLSRIKAADVQASRVFLNQTMKEGGSGPAWIFPISFVFGSSLRGFKKCQPKSNSPKTARTHGPLFQCEGPAQNQFGLMVCLQWPSKFPQAL
jgi:AAA lid domain